MKATYCSLNDRFCFSLQLFKRHGFVRRDVEISKLIDIGRDCAVLKIIPVIPNKAFRRILVRLSQLCILKQVPFFHVVKPS